MLNCGDSSYMGERWRAQGYNPFSRAAHLGDGDVFLLPAFRFDEDDVAS